MPYDSIADLPDTIKENLPKAAQEIYQGAYNSTWEEFDTSKERQDDASKEDICHLAAMNAVEEEYKKENDHWVKKE